MSIVTALSVVPIGIQCLFCGVVMCFEAWV